MTTHQHAIYPSLRDKTVLITGGAEGIGAATVELFAKQGSKVIILDISDESASTLIQKITTLSQETTTQPHLPPIPIPTFHKIDVSDLPALQTLTQTLLSQHERIDILINNAASAGSAARKPTLATTPSDWQYNLDVNLRHIFFLTQAVIPGMRAAGAGSIVNMGSITWRIPATGLPVYTTVKAAIMGLTRTHAREFGHWGIRVNSVMPGAIATERQVREVLTEEYRAEVMGAQALKRDLGPEEVAKVVVFLASAEASAVTGSSYVVDGGWCGDP